MFEKALKDYIEKFGIMPQIAEGRGNNNNIAIRLIEAVISNQPLPSLSDPEGADL